MAETFQWSPKHVLVNFREYLQTDTEGEKVIPSTCFSWNMCVGGVFPFLVIYLGSETQTITIWKKKDPSPSPSHSPCPLHCWAFPLAGGWGSFIRWMSFCYTLNLFAQKIASLFWDRFWFPCECQSPYKNHHTSCVVHQQMTNYQGGWRVGRRSLI